MAFDPLQEEGALPQRVSLEENPEIFEESPFTSNLAEDLSEKVLSNMGRVVCEDYKNDLGSRTGFDTRIKEWNKLFNGLKEVKNTPWTGASNVKLPILGTSCLQSYARTSSSILPSRQIAKCWSTDGETVQSAERCEKFMNYQLTDKMEEWIDGMNNLLLMLPIYGGAVKKTCFDQVLGRNKSFTLSMDEFVAPYGVKRLEDAPRKTHVYDEYMNDVKIKMRDGVWLDVPDVKNRDASSTTHVPAQEMRQSADEAAGTEPSADAKDRPRKILEQHRTWDLNGDGIGEWYIVTTDLETEKVLRVESLEYEDPTDGKTKVFDYFTAYKFIPNPDSWMGLGYGHLLEHINHAMNTLVNQLIDSGKLANTISGFYNTRSGIKDGDLQFDMGQFNALDMSGDDIKKAIYILEFSPPSQVLFNLLGLLQNYSQELASVSDSMLGKLPPSDTTATSMLTVMEQGLKLHSTISQGIHRDFKKELKKIALLNAFFIDEDEYFVVQDSTSGDMVGYTLGKTDFSNSIDVMPVSDPNITSNSEKLIKARSAYELLRNDPAIADDEQAVYRLQYNLMDALQIKNIDQILKKPEPPPPPPDLRPEQEEAEFLAERGVNPLPHQDHSAHLESHEAFRDGDYSQRLTPQGKKLLDGHIRETIAMQYLQLKQLEGELNEQAGQVGLQGLANEPVYQGDVGEFGGVEDIAGLGFGQEV
jgi:hypothetical protein